MSLNSTETGKEFDNELFIVENDHYPYHPIRIHEGCGGEVLIQNYGSLYCECLKCQRSWLYASENYDDDDYNDYVITDPYTTPVCRCCNTPMKNDHIIINGIPYRVDMTQFDVRKYLCEDCQNILNHK